MIKIQAVVILLSLSILLSCTSENKIQLKSGDLLFCGKSSSGISQAIDKVTQTHTNTHFSHVGMVEASDSGIFVLHASPEGGTCKISLSEFLHTEGEKVTVVAYRLKAPWRKAISAALRRSHEMLGQPYNFSYILSDSAHYCSEFVYRAFAPDSIFRLEPMTFKDAETQNFSPEWVEYYKKMNLQIPEGLPGCNPNGLAASNRLEQLGIVSGSK